MSLSSIVLAVIIVREIWNSYQKQIWSETSNSMPTLLLTDPTIVLELCCHYTFLLPSQLYWCRVPEVVEASHWISRVPDAWSCRLRGAIPKKNGAPPHPPQYRTPLTDFTKKSLYTRYYTLIFVRDVKFQLKSGTGNDPPPLRDKVPLFPSFFYCST